MSDTPSCDARGCDNPATHVAQWHPATPLSCDEHRTPPPGIAERRAKNAEFRDGYDAGYEAALQWCLNTIKKGSK